MLGKFGSNCAEEKNLTIVDCRPVVRALTAPAQPTASDPACCGAQLNAVGNVATGGGWEDAANYSNCTLEFMNIENIHAVRQALAKLRSLFVVLPASNGARCASCASHAAHTAWWAERRSAHKRRCPAGTGPLP
jgi:hypothetical protein